MVHRTDSRSRRAKPSVRRTDSVPPAASAAVRDVEPPEAEPSVVGAPARPVPLDAGLAPEDSVAGCNARAAADLSRAAAMDTLNGRRRLEASASSWSVRAALLQRDADGFEAVRALAIAEWKEGEEAARYARPDDDQDP
jgi:hypothetical protein